MYQIYFISRFIWHSPPTPPWAHYVPLPVDWVVWYYMQEAA